VELAVTGPLALGVGVMDEQGETPTVEKAMPETTYITESPFRSDEISKLHKCAIYGVYISFSVFGPMIR
jgi:hypothetical protein